MKRNQVPKGLQRLTRRAYVAAGRPTAALRADPDFIVIGAQRSGTTSLFRALVSHPRIVRPTFHKGVNYFDLNYFRGRSWYRGHFPTVASARASTRRHGPPVVFESSGYYLYHPDALARAARDLPAVKIVVMLRDPIERAYSAFEHERARGFEWEDFERALDLEDERLVGEIDRMRRNPAYESFPHRHHSYVRRGQYAEQLRAVYALFPADRVHVMQSEAYFEDPNAEFRALTDFLEIEPIGVERIGRHNARPRAPMHPRTRQRLDEHFAPHDEALAEMLGETPMWRRSAA